MLRKVFLFSLACCTVFVLFQGVAFFQKDAALAPAVFAQDSSQPAPAGKGGEEYPEQGIAAGVWNEGQAVFWDLHLIDHFRYFGAPERARGYKPEQPIPFSHVTHVKENQMECQYCHWSVEKSSYAAIPEVETCMGCHRYISGRTEEQQEWITKLRTYWDNSGEPYGENGEKSGLGAPIPWQKVHAMPNYIKFNHKRHVKAGVSCHACHGQIPEMEVVERVSSMKMGWCIDCHRQQGSSIDCATCHY
ncbi:cytochrome c family protein [bacterium]|nr:cytochrome c family protein [bacterium]